MIPTPDISHLTARDYDLVYEPAEDTFLLLDALEHDFDDLKALSPATCLEIGSGTGCVSSFIGQILGSSTLYLCTDINSHACNYSFEPNTHLFCSAFLSPSGSECLRTSGCMGRGLSWDAGHKQIPRCGRRPSLTQG
ncbi:hypothetical protein E1B28_001391 [Marasmius oreades]|uniref:Uncharacterized protein n=1 Tax=Marasmius oreades TaxID=181124 RepID=A0A9P7V3H4_9AGAR|nr:uncharacterized protein E1B28_001391 [Marasmius oreades]KAG7099558.1 hypothetical protein E1B28_001391 [Marasmius oreades]